MANLVSPYINTELFTTVQLHPNQLNQDLYLNLISNLRKKVEKKCSQYGYITKVYKIISYSSGYIVAEDFMTSSRYDVKYSGRICYPIEETMIICKINMLKKQMITAENGPIITFIKSTDFNQKIFKRDQDGNMILSKTNEKIKSNDYAKIIVKQSVFRNGDERIIVIGYLYDIANKTEVSKYYNENLTYMEDEETVNTATTDNESVASDNEAEDTSNYMDI